MGSLNLQYASDITQIITYPGASRQIMANRTVNEIVKINEYDRTWRIKTIKNKFQFIPLAVTNTNDIVVDGSKIDNSRHGKILGLTRNRSGRSKHLENI